MDVKKINKIHKLVLDLDNIEAKLYDHDVVAFFS